MQLAIDLAFIFEDWVRTGRVGLVVEIRHRVDGLGLSPKGRRDLRFRVVAPEPAEEAVVPLRASRRRLRAVDPTAADRETS